MKRLRIVFFSVVCLLFALAATSFAQEEGTIDLETLLKEDHQNTQISTESMKTESETSWERLDLLNSTASNGRTGEGDRIRSFSLYPQSFAAMKPEVYQMTPARSYFLSFNDRDKEHAFVGLANIGGEEKIEPQKMYQGNLNSELLLGYQWGGFGSILFGRGVQFERERDSFGHLSDMGWRIKFLKTF